jgi:Flp pilus assembly protein TadD
VLVISLLILALLGPVFHLVGILSRGVALLYAQVPRLILTYIILSLSAAAGAYVALRKSHWLVRGLAALALLVNLGSIIHVANAFSQEMSKSFADIDMSPVPPGQVGIVVAPADPSSAALEWAHTIENELRNTIRVAQQDTLITVRHGSPVHTEPQAIALGLKMNANIVVWPETDNYTIQPVRYHVTVLGANETDVTLEPHKLMLLLATQVTYSVNNVGLEAADLKPAQLVAPVASGFAFMAVGKPMFAAVQFQYLLQNPAIPDDIKRQVHNYYGTALLYVPRADLAEIEFTRSNTIAPNGAAWVGLGTIALTQRDWRGAEYAFHQALGLDPYSTAPYCGRGIILSEQRAVARAVSVYQQAVLLQAESNVPYALMGLAYELAGSVPEAVEAYRRAALHAGPNAGLQLAALERAERIQRNPPTAVPTATPIPLPTATPIPESALYTVQRGDTLRDIADKTGVPMEEIVRLNRIENPNALSVGQVLIIPEKPQ